MAITMRNWKDTGTGKIGVEGIFIFSFIVTSCIDWKQEKRWGYKIKMSNSDIILFHNINSYNYVVGIFLIYWDFWERCYSNKMPWTYLTGEFIFRKYIKILIDVLWWCPTPSYTHTCTYECGWHFMNILIICTWKVNVNSNPTLKNNWKLPRKSLIIQKEIFRGKWNSVYPEANGKIVYTISKCWNNMAQLQIIIESGKQSTWVIYFVELLLVFLRKHCR